MIDESVEKRGHSEPTVDIEQSDRCDSMINVNECVHSIISKQLTIDEFVVKLEHLLTSTKLENRFNGVNSLYSVIKRLPKDYLNENEANHFSRFFIIRLHDQYSIVNVALKAIHFLFKNYHVSNEITALFTTTLNAEIQVASQPLEDRFIIYQIFGILLENYIEDLKQIKSDFLIGFIQAAEGERDPRCLLVIFHTFVKITENLSLGHLDEEMFELVGCYFPVTYNPYTLTREELSEALLNCFKASPSFAPYAIPLIIEKLESDLDTSKIDAYDVLSRCCSVYGIKQLEPFIPIIWTNIRNDSLKSYSATSGQIVAALNALEAIIKTIHSNSKTLNEFLELVFKDLEPTLRKIELCLLKPTVKIFKIIASCGADLYEKVAKFVYPVALEHCSFRSKIEKVDAFEIFNELFSVVSNLKLENIEYKSPHQESILLLCLSSLSPEDSDLCITALRTLETMFSATLSLSNEEQVSISHKFLDLIMKNENDKILCKSRQVLQKFVFRCPQTSRDHILSILFAKVKNDCLSGKSSPLSLQLIDTLKYCLVDDSLKCDYLSFGMQIIFESLKAKNESKTNVIFSQNIIDVINDDLDDNILCDQIVDPVMKAVTHMCLCNDDEDFIENASCLDFKPLFDVTSAAFRKLSIERTKQFVDAVIALLLLHSYTQLLPQPPPICHCDLNVNMKMQLFLNEPYIRILMQLVHSLFCHMNCNVVIPYYDGLLQKMLNFVENDSEEVSKLSLDVIASLVNKTNDEQVSSVFDNLMKSIINLIHSQEFKRRGIDLLIALYRAMVTSGKRESEQLASMLLSFLNKEDDKILVINAANAFVLVHNENHINESNARVSVFYHQKVYFQTLPALMQGFTNEDYPKWRKQAFAIAILGQLKYLSNNLLKTEFKKIRSLINFSLEDSTNVENQVIALDCILHLMDSDSSLLSNVESTVFQLLYLTKNSTLLKIRHKAAECLALVANLYSERTLLPLRNQVVNDLKFCLDDKKRLVRYAAAEARLKWILIGQPK
ncbi:hypothetical protein B4U79_16430 [Dinothrombium tinctorium]|uniref:MMS19 nucleotide excision repair protein n=1 Tax=Dinothrombium tinctorium TaxID=1965070 RepID=A0A3S3P3C9_9ACAR|nr:hypothetical protein B4U79_16430 [Dinothrombium tinctorium]